MVEFREIAFAGFMIIGTLAGITWLLGYLQYGILLAGTFPLLPYYSPHKYNIVMYSLAYCLFYDRRFRGKALAYFFMTYLFQESLDNLWVVIPFLLTSPNFNYGFANIPPYNGGILWVFIFITLIGSLTLFLILRPKVNLTSYWRIAFLFFYYWVDRGYINSIVQSLPTDPYGYLLEILRNSTYLFLVVAIIFPRESLPNISLVSRHIDDRVHDNPSESSVFGS